MLNCNIQSVADVLLSSPWNKCARGYTKFIGSVGTIAVVPGRPHEWYDLIKNEFKKRWYCCECGIDWWFQPIREKCGKNVHYGVNITITDETKQYFLS